ncbi:hypothetical protein tb265_16720 [Gemmatimonadetes bacterium T265]|nr:hypothetical protein tb265_16720 [Gemmatimonadetes bacterium T265]
MPGSQDPGGKSLGMGGEAVENVHAAQQEAAGNPPSPGAASQQNAATTGTAGGESAGSEPIAGRETEHVSGYGGKLGAARTSADEREPADPTGNTNVGGGNPSPS